MKDKKPDYVFSLILATLLTISLTNCKKSNFENESVLRQLYITYKDGRISECKLNGETVYSASVRSTEMTIAVYDKMGNRIGRCTDLIDDDVCNQYINCETIYLAEGNIWGEPAIDKYGLGK